MTVEYVSKYIPGTEAVQHIHQTLPSLLYDNVCSTDINECLEFDSDGGSGSGGIGRSSSGSGDSQEVCRPDQRCVNTFGSFLCLCLPGFTSVAGACLGKSMHYATDVQTTLYQYTMHCIPFLEFSYMHTSTISALDINECAIENGQCSQLCNNTPGSFMCGCQEGFQLDFNERDCISRFDMFILELTFVSYHF